MNVIYLDIYKAFYLTKMWINSFKLYEKKDSVM